MKPSQEALLKGLWNEIDRIYCNHYQISLSDYGTDDDTDNIFKDIMWRSYDWNEPEKPEPNLEINGVKIWWYKYFGRGMEADKEITMEWYDETYKKLIDEEII